MSSRNTNPQPRLLVVLLAVVAASVLGLASSASAQTIQDIGRVEGVRNRQLKGFGLVFGLQGTGDSPRNAYTQKLLSNLSKHLGIEVDAQVASKNVAVVMVTATVSSWLQTGSEFTVEVSSMGDAKSLVGGHLLEVRLGPIGSAVIGEEGVDTYAIAQGELEAIPGGNTTTARCTATLEKDVSFRLRSIQKDEFKIILDRPDFSSASVVARAINEDRWIRGAAAGVDVIAEPRGLGAITVRVPEAWRGEGRFIEYVSRIMTDIRLEDLEAKVVVDETGPTPTVVVTGEARVKPVVLLYKGLEIRIDDRRKENGSSMRAGGFPLLIEVLDGLQQNGLTAEDMPGIIKSIHTAGALVGRLVVREAAS
ncbi:MAG: flagellar basal body P-ring protein FlgI [Planctomycetes bacterium]|nr:flagellar basal body P-ring protein FlgI [Planctomycetota bacterium]